ncbi:uncharacterized protein LOC123524597 [Mercenaria mercenaria]|uniref:uncharacterized protein LOC123524597 n=1 Tax=Mercenaria mercenaria TaxID=6596 RepID=UPI00234E3BD4|nr:uncharacterized protein LOC123524597 [Mercenaria mercenaria]
MENKRSTNFKLKILITLAALILVIAYMRGHFTDIRRQSTRSRFNTIDRDRARYSLPDKKLDRTSWDQNSNLHKDELDKSTRDFANKEPIKTRLPVDDSVERKKTWSNEASNLDTGNKEKSDTFKTNGTSTLEKNMEKTFQTEATDNVKTGVTNKTTAGRKKLNLKTVTKIVMEILDRLNINYSNTTFGRQQEKNKLSHTAVGNISKEILRQNFSRNVARAVIRVLTKGVSGTTHNYTLGKQLWTDYVNNTKQSRLSGKYGEQGQFRDPSQRPRYEDRYHKLVGYYPPKKIQDIPPERLDNLAFRNNGQKLGYRDNRQQLVHSDNQLRPRIKEQLQQGYVDQTQPGYRAQSQPGYRAQTQPGYRAQSQPGYRENPLPARNGGQQPMYRDDHESSKLRQNQQRRLAQPSMYQKSDRQQSKYGNDQQFKDRRQLPGYRNDQQIRTVGDYAQQPMQSDIQQRNQANPIKKRSADRDQRKWYRDGTQLKFLMDHPEQKRSVKDTKETDTFDREQDKEGKKIDEKRSADNMEETENIDKVHAQEVQKVDKKRSAEDVKETENINKAQAQEVKKVD